MSKNIYLNFKSFYKVTHRVTPSLHNILLLKKAKEGICLTLF